MKAIVWTNYGTPEVLQLQEVAKPTPKANEVLIKIHATTVSAGDCEARQLNVPIWLWFALRLYVGLRKPQRITILGQELAGEIEAVGKEVTLFKVGDPIFAAAGLGFGGYAEYICLPEKPQAMRGALAIKPTNMSYEEAAAVPIGGLEALHFLRQANIQPGEKVLVNGAAGSIGTFGVQLAKYFGAEVTGVDSGEKLDMLRALGADQAIDYTQTNFSQTGQQYDVIFDVPGKSSFSGGVNSLKPHGRYLLVNPTPLQMVRGAWISRRSHKKIIFGSGGQKNEDLIFLKELIEAGRLKAVIDRRYPLVEMVAAHRYVDSGRKQGNVVIVM